jgi:hypothetical protein
MSLRAKVMLLQQRVKSFVAGIPSIVDAALCLAGAYDPKLGGPRASKTVRGSSGRDPRTAVSVCVYPSRVESSRRISLGVQNKAEIQ